MVELNSTSNSIENFNISKTARRKNLQQLRRKQSRQLREFEKKTMEASSAAHKIAE